MRPSFANTFLLALFVLSCTLKPADATALSYRLAAHEKACFYAWPDKVDTKISLYFAVQTGGAFDIDYSVTDPRGHSILSGQKERQGDYVFTSKDIGEYAFCFSNGMSTFAEKLVDFDISVENESKPAALDEPKPKAGEEHVDNMDEVLYRISGRLPRISRGQKYFRTREHRNSATVKSTGNRIFWFAVLQSGMVITVAVLQVFFIRTFFSATKRGQV